jgi:metal-responsive CopG/Arc/MetJ family transcriptional regulator
MESVKTAVSLRKSLFEEMESLARKMKVPRSRLFALALEDYIRRQENRKLLMQIDAAYTEECDPGEETLRRKYRRQHRRMVEGEW